MAVAFDTLKAFRRLQAAGFDEAKADVLVSIFAEDISASLATKSDVAATRAEIADTAEQLRAEIASTAEQLRAEVAGTEERLRTEIASTEDRLRAEIARTEQRLTIRMGAMVGGGVALVLTALGIVTGLILSAI